MTPGTCCPACRGPLSEDLRCVGCGRGYGTFAGLPVLVEGIDPASVDLRDDEAPLAPFDSTLVGIGEVDEALARGDRMLELGAGRAPARHPGIVRTDRFVYGADGLDVVADAHALPFPDASFDFVFSLAVFEHLERPWVAAAEIARVLRPGGRVYVLAAFMQRLHGYPSHYFNATESGLRALFSDGFAVESAGPSAHCPHEETVNLLRAMGDMAAAYRPRGARDRWRAWTFRRALPLAGRRYTQLAPAMAATPAGREAWRHIAPAVELTAVRRPAS